MRRSTTTGTARAIAAAITAAALASTPGCGGGGGGGGGGMAGLSVSGHVTFDGAAAAARRPAFASVGRVVEEREPNGTIDTATDLGDLAVGAHVTATGRVVAGEASDAIDGFRLRATERVLVTASIASVGAAAEASADLAPDFDLAVYDPIAMQVVQVAATAGAAETTSFVANGSCFVLVTASRGGGRYQLTLDASPVAGRTAARGASPALCGELRSGDALRLVSDPADPPAGTRSFLVACPEAVHLDAAVTGSVEVRMGDASEDSRSPAALSTFVEADGRDVDAGSLLRVDVAADAGAVFGVTLTASPTASPPLARVERTGRVAGVDLEAAWIRGLPPGVRFGLPTHPITAGKALVRLDRATADDARAKGAADLRRAALGCRVGEDVSEDAVAVMFDLPESLAKSDRARATWSRIEALRSTPGTVGVDASYRRYAKKTPNDTRYGEQWDLPQIRCPEAWDVTTGSSAVIVAVIDTGKTDHPDLSGKQGAGYDFISDATNAKDGNGRDGDPTDVGDGSGGEPSSFHGTHVSGTIGAATNNGLGVAGIAWGATLMPLRVLGVDGGDDADIIAAIRYAAGLTNASGQLPGKRANVINMSLGGGGYDQTFQDAITAARNAGVVIFAAAGNSGTTELEYPASFDGVVSVGAVDRNSKVTSYSNRNAAVDLAAPGGDSSGAEANGVLSTIYDDSNGTPTATYAFYDGTSMATPHAAGVAALVLSVAPTLSPAQVESILTTTAKDLGTAGRDDSYGYGLIDAKAAVDKAKATGTGGPLLSLGASSIAFDDASPVTRDVPIDNVGGGKVTVRSATARTDSGGGWLAATLVGAGNAARSADAVRVTILRTGLADGSYTGSVTVDSDAGSAVLAVALRVGAVTGGGGAATDVWVLAVDVATNDTVADVLVPADGDGTYTLADLPSGTYAIVAGSDDNDDGYIGDPGEWYGEAVGSVTVADGRPVENVEIVVSKGTSSRRHSITVRGR